MPRPATQRLVIGGGSYVDDLAQPRMLHAAFLRSPHANAVIEFIDVGAARTAPGVVAVFTAADIAMVCKGWLSRSNTLPHLRSPMQHPLAVEQAVWQGEPVAIVIADSRVQAEDALEAIEINWMVLPSCTDLASVGSEGAALVHPALGSNLALEHLMETGDVDRLFTRASLVVHERFVFSRQTGLPLETRGLIASYDPGEGTLTVWQSTQVPNQSKVYLAQVLDIPSHRVRVIAPDVGGGFGMKLHVYPDEVAVCAASRLIGRPVKYICDRLESFASDVHAREHIVEARLAVTAEGKFLAFEVDDTFGIGAYSSFPRPSVMEATGMLRMIGAPYAFRGYRGRLRAYLFNKPPIAQVRGVGHPIAAAVTERLVDKAARALGLDPLGIRALNYLEPGAERVTTPAGALIFDVSHTACQRKLVGLMDLPALRTDCDRLRRLGIWRGIGFATYVEVTVTGPRQYGSMGIAVSATDTATVSLELSGGVTCVTSVTEQGQGTTAAIAQIIADAVGVSPGDVAIVTGDTATSGMGGGAFASRGTANGGEVAWKAGRQLRSNILRVAAALLQCSEDDLDIRAGAVVDVQDGETRISLKALAQLAYFDPTQLPVGTQAQFSVTSQFYREGDGWLPCNGIHGALVEVDAGTGLVRLLNYWVVDDCGRVINPLLLDEQVRGGVVQGLGPALYEHLPYDSATGQLLLGTLADYRLPLASEMTDIVVGHVETPYSKSELGAKGAGEGGACGAPAAVLNAVNDALSPFGAEVARFPLSPETILSAIAAAKKEVRG
ncbi:MAG: xanthine dehydrogenase family protein [Hyphomicrobiales bacterium]|nr:xanthine dehydrogenase family protein [Hyphomicrobiales bacterium]